MEGLLAYACVNSKKRMERFWSTLAEAGSGRLLGDRRYAVRKVVLKHGVWLEAVAFSGLLELAGEA